MPLAKKASQWMAVSSPSVPESNSALVRCGKVRMHQAEHLVDGPWPCRKAATIAVGLGHRSRQRLVQVDVLAGLGTADCQRRAAIGLRAHADDVDVGRGAARRRGWAAAGCPTTRQVVRSASCAAGETFVLVRQPNQSTARIFDEIPGTYIS